MPYCTLFYGRSRFGRLHRFGRLLRFGGLSRLDLGLWFIIVLSALAKDRVKKSRKHREVQS